jgi:hypothetical protein
MAQIKEIELHVLSCTQQPMQSPEKLADNIWFHSLHVPKIGWLRTLYQGCIRATRKKIREINPDLVHGHGTERNCAISAALSGYPNLVTVHGNMAQIARMNHARIGSFQWLAARLENFTLATDARRVLCNSAVTRNRSFAAARAGNMAGAPRVAASISRSATRHRARARLVLLNVPGSLRQGNASSNCWTWRKNFIAAA